MGITLYEEYWIKDISSFSHKHGLVNNDPVILRNPKTGTVTFPSLTLNMNNHPTT